MSNPAASRFDGYGEVEKSIKIRDAYIEALEFKILLSHESCDENREEVTEKHRALLYRREFEETNLKWKI